MESRLLFTTTNISGWRAPNHSKAASDFGIFSQKDSWVNVPPCIHKYIMIRCSCGWFQNKGMSKSKTSLAGWIEKAEWAPNGCSLPMPDATLTNWLITVFVLKYEVPLALSETEEDAPPPPPSSASPRRHSEPSSTSADWWGCWQPFKPRGHWFTHRGNRGKTNWSGSFWLFIFVDTCW